MLRARLTASKLQEQAQRVLRGIPQPAQITWEHVACPLCEGDSPRTLLEMDLPPDEQRCTVAECEACSMVYLTPRPDAGSIGQYYSRDYKPYQCRSARSGSWTAIKQRLTQSVLAARLGYPLENRHWVDSILGPALAPFLLPSQDSITRIPYHGEGKLLDFGCGAGWLAHRLQQRGWDVTGIDFSPIAAQQVRESYGIPVHVGSLPHSAIAPESFDVITMGSVLEHVHDPHAILNGAVDALRPGGLLVIVVPNIASWGFRTFGKDWFALDLPRHLLHFSPKTLTRLVQEHGLEVRALRMLGRKSWLRRSLEQSASHRWMLRAPFLTSALTRWTVRTGQADCMLVLASTPSR